MFEFGRPSHIFDLDKIHDGLVVRWGAPGEPLKLLNGNTVELDENVGVIADAQAVESLAGIMGGDATAVERRHAQRLCRSRVLVARGGRGPLAPLQLHHRRRPPLRARRRSGGTVEHIERITQLIIDICGGHGRARWTTSRSRCRSARR